PSLLVRMTGFMLVSMVFQTLYYLVDLYWVGRLGKEAIAAVSVAGNLTFLVLAATQMLAVGTTTLVSHAAGRKDRDEVVLVFNQSQVLSLLAGAVFLVAGRAFHRAYASGLGADAATAALAADYLVWFIPAMALQFGLVAIAAALRGIGNFKPGMVVQTGTVVLNIVLAPVLMFGWLTSRPLGVAGAALASFIAVALGVLALVCYVLRHDAYLRFTAAAWRPRLELWGRLLGIGVPAGAEFALLAVYLFVVYGVSRPFGAEAQAGFGIGMRVLQSGFMPVVALAFAAAPIAGQNFGAGLPDRVRETCRSAMTMAIGVTAGFMIACLLAPAAIMRVFSSDLRVIAVGVEYLRIVSWNFVASGVIFVSSSMFQAMGNTLPALISSSVRIVLFALPVIAWSRMPGFQLRHVWYLSVASVGMQLLLNLVLLRREFRLRLGGLAAAPVRAVTAALVALVLLPGRGAAQAGPVGRGTSGAALARQVHEYRRAHEREILAELVELLAVPNVAADSVNIRANAALLVGMLERRGARARLLQSPAGGPPAVYGELATPGAQRTVVVYAHYDGQPVRREDWHTDPWRPVLRAAPGRGGDPEIPLPAPGDTVAHDARLYARSASDDKAPIVLTLIALDVLRAAGAAPSVNLKFFFEGEEEAGSPHLEALLREHAAALRNDLWLFCDGPVHASGRPQLVLGARGIVDLDLTLYGANRALHSGHYGNWAPNPLLRLAHLVSGMRDRHGRIRIPGFYADVRPPTQAERAAVRAAPATDDSLRRSFGLAATEGDGALVGERVLLPALNLRAISGGTIGVNAIAPEATASIDIRLVPEQRPARVRELVEAYVRGRGYKLIHDTGGAELRSDRSRVALLRWGEGYASVRTAPESPDVRAIARLMEQATGEPPVIVPSSGGSLPLDIFQRSLGAAPIVVPIVNTDNNQHAANENVRVGNLWDGLAIYAAIFAGLGER
ncbi:MAG TPA: MATE family efflux transporter, partial [Gemmatimonadales bacterium]|nr:MATE family efflux transporter [Gemmatimonadales bacterium]